MQPTKRLQYVPDPNKFDLVTHKWDHQGALIEKNLYRSYILDGRQYFERPVNSGNLFFENNQPAGRVEYTFGPTGKISSKKFMFEADHKTFVAPLVGDEKLHFELEQMRAKNAQLEAELSAISKDSVKKESMKETKTVEVPTLTKKV